MANPMPRAAARLRSEDGSTLPLIIFFATLGLVLVLLVTAATSLYLERKRLFSLADGAALVGAEAFELNDVSVTGGVLRPTLTDAEVRHAVDSYITDNPIGRFRDLGVADAGTQDGESATVTLTASWRPPVVSLLVPDGIRLRVTSVARSVFW
jgi:hypothetical protein